jgi:hypothetical protein
MFSASRWFQNNMATTVCLFLLEDFEAYVCRRNGNLAVGCVESKNDSTEGMCLLAFSAVQNGGNKNGCLSTVAGRSHNSRNLSK